MKTYRIYFDFELPGWDEKMYTESSTVTVEAKDEHEARKFCLETSGRQLRYIKKIVEL